MAFHHLPVEEFIQSIQYFSYLCLHLYIIVLGSLVPQKNGCVSSVSDKWKVLGIDVMTGYTAGIISHTDCPLLLIK